MGCGTRTVTVRMEKKEDALAFAEAWNAMLERFGCADKKCQMSESAFDQDNVWKNNNIADLFVGPNETGLLMLCRIFSIERPTAKFSIEYFVAGSDEEGITVERYSVRNGRIVYEQLDGQYLCEQDEYERNKEEYDAMANGDELMPCDGAYYHLACRIYGIEGDMSFCSGQSSGTANDTATSATFADCRTPT